MIEWERYPIGPLIETYSVANTASFLLGKFRDDSSVKALAKGYSVTELSDALAEVLAKENWQIPDPVRAYAVMAALSSSRYEEIKAAIKDLPLARLRWGYQILDLVRTRSTPTSIVLVPFRPAFQDVPSKARSSTTATKIEIARS